MGGYSSIKRKPCHCGCGRMPTLGYGGYKFSCAPQEILDKVGRRKDVIKRNKNARNRVSALLRRDNDADRKKLLEMADKLFGNWIKKRACANCCNVYANVGEFARLI